MGDTPVDMTDVAIIGAGPYGLAAAVQLRRRGIETEVLGDPMSFWRCMPEGMLLRSNWGATNIVEHDGELSLDAYQAATGARFGAPVALEHFVAYGEWLQRTAVPDVDRRHVVSLDWTAGGLSLELDDGHRLKARRVVVACGIGAFARRPPGFDHLPPALASHTGDHRSLSAFAGRRVAVVGGGQSALEAAALLRESGAQVEVLVRRDHLTWLHGGAVHRRLGRLAPIVYAPTDVGPLWYSRLVSVPELFRRLPRSTQTRVAARSIRPAGALWLRGRLDGVPIRVATTVTSTTAREQGLILRLSDGTRHEVDHLLFGTGYRVDVARYPFMTDSVITRLRRVDGQPVLSAGFASSVPGLHFLGAPAAWSFGPIMRFVSGTWFAARELARHVAAEHDHPVVARMPALRRTTPVAEGPLPRA